MIIISFVNMNHGLNGFLHKKLLLKSKTYIVSRFGIFPRPASFVGPVSRRARTRSGPSRPISRPVPSISRTMPATFFTFATATSAAADATSHFVDWRSSKPYF